MIIRPVTKNRLYLPADVERKKNSASMNDRDARDSFEKDYGRIVHSAAFRRLQSKTQVIGLDVGDFHRTRLTHSMEVAQIARGIVIHLNANHPVFKEDYALDASLIEAAALAHDLGHPPFGHRGEEALHKCMQHYGGFEGNAHTFRILTRLEGDKENGLNLTRALLLSIMKYPILLDDAVCPKQYVKQGKVHPPKASAFLCDQEAFAWTLASFTQEEREFFMKTIKPSDRHLQTINKTLECSIIELADDIAYGTHDVEDSINLGLIRIAQLKELMDPVYRKNKYPELIHAFKELDQLDPDQDQLKYRLKKIFSAIISTLITRLCVEIRNKPVSPRLKYQVQLPPDLRLLLDQLKQLVVDKVIDSQKVQTVAWKGSYIIQQLFEAFMNEPKLLPENDRNQMEFTFSDEERARIVCDYIAGMTDSFAMKMYARLFGQSRNFFDY
ncbi:anti-phage deoxyguanosine triphosphatase [Paenactinomyces guangxiensis]|uniref:Deoxyguanosinetriphosphate triphosphohydrolase-like protein n=1 Tax=Paenactinomyces guangxiensis TaxID=1490290 RepID=A0A7W1WTD6_9BACL|nr:anti-phage deoxyguanosine triphosphatase [Paenactinomyces guangxiensis]MBA4495726.1 dGTPase [Paenactinomyces guangxiensis]MBH8592715.1 dGTPase [Paenactinomyces guangxiensis]